MVKDWDFSKPDLSNLGDHDVFQIKDNLNNKRVALVLTGGIAAIKAPFMARMLRQYGAAQYQLRQFQGLGLVMVYQCRPFQHL